MPIWDMNCKTPFIHPPIHGEYISLIVLKVVLLRLNAVDLFQPRIKNTPLGGDRT